MNRYDRLLQLLRKNFPNASIELADDSAEHAGHTHGSVRVGDVKDGIQSQTHAHGHDGETHYRVRIRDAGFAGMTRLQMHRKIIAAVQSEFDAGHAHGGVRVGDATEGIHSPTHAHGGVRVGEATEGMGVPMHSLVIEDCGT